MNNSPRFIKVKHINEIEDISWSIDCLSFAIHILLKLTSSKEAWNDFFPIFAVDTISLINYLYILDIDSDGMKDNYRKSENEGDVGLPSIILYCMLIEGVLTSNRYVPIEDTTYYVVLFLFVYLYKNSVENILDTNAKLKCY